MGTNFALGMTLVSIAGIFSGIFAIPFKNNKNWSWENNWLLWSIVSLIIMPWIVSLITIPDLFAIYSQLPNTVILVFIFGVIWGVGAILWGLGIEYLGVALSIPIMSGLNNSVGTLMPIIIRDSSELLTPQGIKIMVGVLILLIGIIICSRAGSLKEKLLNNNESGIKSKKFIIGLIICLLAGIIGPMINFGFIYGEPLKEKAIEFGATQTLSSNAIWSIVLSGGFIINIVYCIYLFKRNKSTSNYKKGNTKYWILASLSGVLWYLSIMFYGMGGSNLGISGASVGWATMQSLAIIAANIAGILSGEWKGAHKKHFRIMFTGMTFLVLGILIIAFA